MKYWKPAVSALLQNPGIIIACSKQTELLLLLLKDKTCIVFLLRITDLKEIDSDSKRKKVLQKFQTCYIYHPGISKSFPQTSPLFLCLFACFLLFRTMRTIDIDLWHNTTYPLFNSAQGSSSLARSLMKGGMKQAVHGELGLHNANGMSWQTEWETEDGIMSGRQVAVTNNQQNTTCREVKQANKLFLLKSTLSVILFLLIFCNCIAWTTATCRII